MFGIVFDVDVGVVVVFVLLCCVVFFGFCLCSVVPLVVYVDIVVDVDGVLLVVAVVVC